MTSKEFETVGQAIAARNERLFKEQAERRVVSRERVKAVKPLTPDQVQEKYSNRKRTGKTAKDHASGAWKQRLENRAARAEK